MDFKQRCDWGNNEIMRDYHDREWGVPIHDDQILFEFLILEGFQAGLSWETILKKRQNFRIAFEDFNYRRVSLYDASKVSALLLDAGIIRNRLKIEAAIHNAGAFQKIQAEFGSFDAYAWQFVGGKQLRNCWNNVSDIPATTEKSVMMSDALRSRGFKFVGPTICNAFMQAVGMVNDHITGCYRYTEIYDL
jgi:DNA-3-methyladenine glycosylase I